MTLFEEMLDKKIIAIIRGVASTEIVPAVEALYKGGLCFVEVTYRPASKEESRDTLRSIALLKERFAPAMHIGAGTVLSVKQVDEAAAAGAEYIISPNTNLSVIARTKELGLLSLPGAYTPSEAESAYEAGADIVKIFPAGTLGPGYFKALKSPLAQLHLAAVGGVSLSNIKDFLAAGAEVFGIGGNLVSAARVKAGDFAAIERDAALYIAAVKAVK